MYNIMKGNFLKRCTKKCEKKESKLIPSAICYCSCWRALWPSKKEKETIPRDVPKGHLVVYVGKDYNRYIIKIALLKHPLFKALLDQAREEYNFPATSKLTIPCDNDMFLSVVRCATSAKDKRVSLYLPESIRGACFNS